VPSRWSSAIIVSSGRGFGRVDSPSEAIQPCDSFVDVLQCIYAVSSLVIQRMPWLHCCNDRRRLILPPVLNAWFRFTATRSAC